MGGFINKLKNKIGNWIERTKEGEAETVDEMVQAVEEYVPKQETVQDVADSEIREDNTEREQKQYIENKAAEENPGADVCDGEGQICNSEGDIEIEAIHETEAQNGDIAA